MDSLKRGLVAYWPLWEPNGSRGNCVVDGTDDLANNVVGDPGQADGIVGYALAPNTFGKKTGAPPALCHFVDEYWAVAGWAMCTDALGRVCFGSDGGAGARRWRMYFNAGPGTILFLTMDGNNPLATSTGPVYTQNRWHHLVGMYTPDDNAVQLWVDAIPYARAVHANPLAVANVAFYVGRSEAADNFAGRICELGGWKRHLTQREVLALYNGGKGLTYPFDKPSPAIRGHGGGVGRRRGRWVGMPLGS